MYVTVDVGSTNIRVGGSRDLSDIIGATIDPTPKGYQDGIEHIARTAKAIAGDERVVAAAVGLPARLTSDKRGIYKVRNLPDWDGKQFADDLERALGAKVSIENDTAQVACGEAVFGAGRGSRIVVYMTVSTGVNAARIVDGAVEPSVHGYETGYQYMSCDADPKDISELISGTAIQEKYGVHPKELGKDHPVWNELARYTAFALHNTLLHWSPEKVVLGGSMFNEIGIPVEGVRMQLAKIMKAFPTLPEIVHSELGDFGGLWGGLARLKRMY